MVFRLLGFPVQVVFLFLYSVSVHCSAYMPPSGSSVPAVQVQDKLSRIQAEVNTIRIELDELLLKRSSATTEEEKVAISSRIRLLGNRLTELDKEVAADAELRGVTPPSKGVWATIKKWLNW